MLRCVVTTPWENALGDGLRWRTMTQSEPDTRNRFPSADLAIGSFSRQGPWVVEPDAMPWRNGIDELRRLNRAEIPRLLAPRRVPPVRRLVLIVTSIGFVLARWYFVDRPRGRSASRWGLSRRLRRVFERLGSTFVKLGQIISSGEGLFPNELVTEFRLLRDRVAPESFSEIREVVERELGAPLDEVFASFDETPIAAASSNRSTTWSSSRLTSST